jgi:hypothetical protein
LTKQKLSKHRACSHARSSANTTRSHLTAAPDRQGQDKSALENNRLKSIGSQAQIRTAGFLTATLDIDYIYFSHPSRLQLLDMQPSPMRKLSTPLHPPIQHTQQDPHFPPSHTIEEQVQYPAQVTASW